MYAGIGSITVGLPCRVRLAMGPGERVDVNSMAIIALRGACTVCKKPFGGEPPGATLGHRKMCKACHDECWTYMHKQRAIFAALLAMGVSREVANKMLITKMLAEGV